MQYLGLHPMRKMSQARDRVDQIIQDFNTEVGISWKITLKGNNELIGYIGFWKIDKKHFRAEIGFGMDKQHQQKGYTTEAILKVLEYGFGELGIHSVKADVDPGNEGSIQLLKKVGFQKEAHFRENYYFDGKFIDSAFYCMILGDWEKRNKSN